MPTTRNRAEQRSPSTDPRSGARTRYAEQPERYRGRSNSSPRRRVASSRPNERPRLGLGRASTQTSPRPGPRCGDHITAKARSRSCGASCCDRRQLMPLRDCQRSPISCFVGAITKQLDLFSRQEHHDVFPTPQAIFVDEFARQPKIIPLSIIPGAYEIAPTSNHHVHIEFAPNHIKFGRSDLPRTLGAV